MNTELNYIKTQNNIMKKTLEKIAKGYMEPKEIEEKSDKEYGLSYEECLEMAYENILGEARAALHKIETLSKKPT